MTDPLRARHLPLLLEDPQGFAEARLNEPIGRDPLGADVLPFDATKPPTRSMLRSRRKREVRARTISLRQMGKIALERGRLLNPPVEGIDRPRTRGECASGERPCPFVSCAHHLYLDVSPNGTIKLNFPDLEVEEMGESCALDVADRGGETLENVGEILNLTRERIRQIENHAMATMRGRGHLREVLGEGSAGGELLEEGESLELEEAPGPVEDFTEAFDLDAFLALEDAGRGPEAA